MTDPIAFMRDRIKEALGNMSFATAALRSGGRLTKSSLHNWVAGKTVPGMDDLIEVAAMTGRDLSFFIPSADQKKSHTLVQRLSVHASAGDGADNSCATVEDELEFPDWMLKSLGAGRARLRILRALGESMEPIIANGALLLVDEKDTDLTKKRRKRDRWDYPNIFVFEYDGETLVKQIRLIQGMVLAESFNSAFEARIFKPKEITVRARVLWWDNHLR